jgi:hypothetical protein
MFNKNLFVYVFTCTYVCAFYFYFRNNSFSFQFKERSLNYQFYWQDRILILWFLNVPDLALNIIYLRRYHNNCFSFSFNRKLLSESDQINFIKGWILELFILKHGQT